MKKRTPSYGLPTRRQIIGGIGAGLTALPLGTLNFSNAAAAETRTDANRLVVIVLRGGMDGLAAVVPYDDPDYRVQRGDLALGRPGTSDGVLDLGNGFGLHPALATLHELSKKNQLLAVHAVATPYRDRSHFSAQDVLENGSSSDLAIKDGWLNRALPAMAQKRAEDAIALGQTIPLILRGGASVASWAPSILPTVNDDTLDRIAMLYESDPVFSRALTNAIAANDIAADTMSAGEEGRAATRFGPRGRFLTTMQAAARFLTAESGPRIAVTELTGWDTHAGQGAASGRLARQLTTLDDGIAALRRELGPAWNTTIVMAVSEFGRTVAINGTGGTDHGTAGAVLLTGGAVNGTRATGKVITDWPGLRTAQLHEGRDLKPTIDLRAVSKGILHDHLRVSRSALDTDVFPDSTGVAPLRDLIAG